MYNSSPTVNTLIIVRPSVSLMPLKVVKWCHSTSRGSALHKHYYSKPSSAALGALYKVDILSQFSNMY